FDGAGGIDELNYGGTANNRGVTVRLAGWVGSTGGLPSGYTGSAIDQWGKVDVFRNVEGVEGSEYNDSITGDANNNVLDGRGGSDTIDGGEGSDTVEYNQATIGIVVDLGQGKTFDDGQGLGQASHGAAVEQDTLISIENVWGGSGSDSITGSQAGNRLEGRDGNDSIAGGDGDDTLLGGTGNDSLLGGNGSDDFYEDSGNDTIDGGNQSAGGLFLTGTVSLWNRLRATADQSAGRDLISYSRSPTAVKIDLGANGEGSVSPLGGMSGWGTDILKDIEFVIGSSFNDELRGSNRDLNEYFRGGLGDDSIYGGAISGVDAGFDFVDYRSSAGSVQVNLLVGTVTGADGNDFIAGIEGVFGGAYADALTGDNRNNFFEGNAGNDTIDGAGGDDLVSYQRATSAVYVDLGAGTSSGPDGIDTLTHVEAVRGSTFNDTLLGGSRNEGFQGWDGNDSIQAGAGDDLLIGGAGDDTLTGASGADIFYYTTGSQGVDLITDLEIADRIEIAASLSGPVVAGNGSSLSGKGVQVSSDGSTTTLFVDTDGVTGADLQIRVSGNRPATEWFIEQAPSNNALPGTVNAYISWRGGPSTSPSTGPDLLTGGLGDDTIDGLAGDDTIDGFDGNDTLSGGEGSDHLYGGVGGG
ncbi:MAG: hypothetical protein EB072_13385, partial [Betaproteobacteria bacterium]|nr:hypothetical protein [Betaproteobacteria bacterium]